MCTPFKASRTGAPAPTSRWVMARRRGAGVAAAAVLWGLAYFFWRLLLATPASA